MACCPAFFTDLISATKRLQENNAIIAVVLESSCYEINI